MSNFTDFDVLERDDRVNLYYTNNVDEIKKADIILLPGSKSTIDDLYELRRNGVAQAILRANREGATVMGICGGYQMMGKMIYDPDGVEGKIPSMPGLGLLPMETTMSGEKITRQTTFEFLAENAPAGMSACTGYEIHMGRTVPCEGVEAAPLAKLADGRLDGYISTHRCCGTYLHGILDNIQVIDWLIRPYTDRAASLEVMDYPAFKEKQYDLLADHVRAHFNMPLLYEILSTDR